MESCSLTLCALIKPQESVRVELDGVQQNGQPDEPY